MKRSTKFSLLLAPLAALSVALGTLAWVPTAADGLATMSHLRLPALAAPAAANKPSTQPVEMEVHDVIPIEEMGTHAVVLVSTDGESILPLFVTEEAAVSIAFRLAEQKSPHPLAADLMDDLVNGLGGKVREVRIDGVENDIYTGHVVVDQGGKDVNIDARPSDAIAMALTGKAKIIASAEVIAEAGISREDIDALRRDMGPGVGGSGPHPFLGGEEEDGELLGSPDDAPIKL